MQEMLLPKSYFPSQIALYVYLFLNINLSCEKETFASKQNQKCLMEVQKYSAEINCSLFSRNKFSEEKVELFMISYS